MSDSGIKCAEKMKEVITKLQQSEHFPPLKDAFSLTAFDVGSTSRLLPPSFPRAVHLMPVADTWHYFSTMSDHIMAILSTPKNSGLMQTLKYFDKINLQQPNILVRSAMLYYFLPPGTGKIYNQTHLTSFISEELRVFNCPPAVCSMYKSIISSHETGKLIFDAFLATCAHVVEGLVAAKCNTRARQRERLAYLLEELGVLQTEAERTDAVIDSILREKVMDKSLSQISSGIGTWTLYLTTKTMIMYLSLGMELELFDVREYCYVFWYMAEILLLWNTSSLFRAENCLAELAHMEKQARKKGRQKKSTGPKIQTNVHNTELLIARSKQHTAAGSYRLMIALKLANLLPSTSDYPYDNEQVRYSHRFAPFSSVSIPQPVPYDSYLSAITPKDEQPSDTTIDEYLEQSCKNFQTAKNILEPDSLKSEPECASILTVAKNNMVVTKLIANCIQKDVKKDVRFDFSVHAVFPLVKLSG